MLRDNKSHRFLKCRKAAQEKERQEKQRVFPTRIQSGIIFHDDTPK